MTYVRVGQPAYEARVAQLARAAAQRRRVDPMDDRYRRREGYPKPPIIDGCRGDVYAVSRDGTRLLIEVEHHSTLGIARTREQVPDDAEGFAG